MPTVKNERKNETVHLTREILSCGWGCFFNNPVILVGNGSHFIDVGLLSAFRGLDEAARRVLTEFSAPFGLEVSPW